MDFSPFYRTEQFIIVPRDQTPIEREDPRNFLRTIEYGPVYRKEFLKEAFDLYDQIRWMSVQLPDEAGGGNVTLNDLCYKPLEPENPNCAIMSLFNYFQVNQSNIFNFSFFLQFRTTFHIWILRMIALSPPTIIWIIYLTVSKTPTQ